jgi:FAD/FMN-containing dehydrogenase
MEMTENGFQSKIQSRLKTILPAGVISTRQNESATNAESYLLLPPGKPPMCIVRPANTDELQAVIRYANEAGLNLTVTSSSGPHIKGGITSQAEHVLIDLSHWRKIDLIDRRNRVCRVEPGVTYGELIATLKENDMTLPMPLAPRSGKSVLAAIMDREPGTWPNKQWDSSDPLGSSEFFFGNGDRFRTGAAGGPGTIEQQRHSGGALKFSSGPSQTDFQRVVQGAQGTMGIVTWITLRTELRPSDQRAFLVGAEDLVDLLPYIYAVQRGCLGEESFILDRTAAAMLMAKGDRRVFEAIRASLPGHICLQNIAGFERLPQERLAYHQQDIERFANQFNLRLEPTIGDVSAVDLLVRATQPCGDVDWRHMLRGHCLSIFFLSTLDRMPFFRETFLSIAEDLGIGEGDIGVYIQPVVQNHGCHLELMVPFDPASTEEVRHMKQLERQTVVRLMEEGAYFSRPYGQAGELVWAKNPANYELVKTIKGLFDPQRVLQRGKWGL